MKNEKIPQYHPSYTEEENKKVHEYLQNASAHELVESIYELCNLYPQEEKESIKKALDSFIKEINMRDMMEQRYNILLSCRNEWNKYVEKLQIYPDVLLIREYYQKFKKTHKAQSAHLVELFIDEYRHPDQDPSKEIVKVIKRYSPEHIRKCTISEKKKSGISKPIKPDTFYTSLEEISITSHNCSDVLEKLGTDNLRYLFSVLLGFLDSDREDITTPIITFLNRRYSYESHKKTSALFTTQTLSYENLKEKSIELLKQITEDKIRAEMLEKELENRI